jgi:hypothetical protein
MQRFHKFDRPDILVLQPNFGRDCLPAGRQGKSRLSAKPRHEDGELHLVMVAWILFDNNRVNPI